MCALGRQKSGVRIASCAEAFFCLDFFGSFLCQDKKNNNRRMEHKLT